MAYNVANNLRVAMPDPIGVDQLKRQNAMAEMSMAQDQQRNALYGQQIEQSAQRFTADQQAQALEQVKAWAPGAIAQVEKDPKLLPQFLAAGQRLGIFDPNRTPDSVTPQDVAQLKIELGIAPAQAPEPIVGQTVNGFSVLTQGGKPIPGGVQAPQREPRPAPVRPQWTKTEQTLPDGTVQAGFVDMNAPDPTATFRPLGSAASPQRGAVDQDRVYRGEDRMKNDFEQLTKDRREELAAAKKVKALALTGGKLNAAQQQALIFMFGKVLDPASVLREGEYDRIASARGYYDTASNLAEKVMAGAILTPKQVRDIGEIASFYENAASDAVRGIAGEYERIATGRGYDPSAIITDPAYRSGAGPKGGPSGGRKSASQYLKEAQGGR